MSIGDHLGKVFQVGDKSYRLVKARSPTPEELVAIKAKQDACDHSHGVHFTDPLTCARCGKVMPG